MASMEETWVAAPKPVRTLGLSWPLLVAMLALLGVLGFTNATGMLSDPDTYWHLAAGRWILEHGAVPKIDPFSHSMPGAEWTAHEWLSELVMVGVHRVAGWTGLAVVAALVFAATLATVLRFLLARMEPVHALLFTAFTAAMLMGHLLVRPHLFAWPLLVVWAGTLIDAGEKRRDPPWWLLALLILWANLHGSFTLGLAIGVALALDAVLTQPKARRGRAARLWGAFIALALLAAMVTPAGWMGLWYSYHTMSLKLALEVIQEWHSPNFHEFQPLEVWLMLMLAVGLSGRVRLPWLRLLLVLGLTHLALKHQRHMTVLGLLTPLLMAAPLARHWASTASAGRDAESIDRVFKALAAPARAGALAGAALIAAAAIALTLQQARFIPNPAATPAAATEAALRAGATGPVLNSYNFGGYLIYKAIPVFFDGRAEMYGDALLKRYLDALMLADPPELAKLMADYNIGWTLLQPGTPAIALLDRTPGWRRVHSDKVAVVHVRNAPDAPGATVGPR